MAAKLAIPPGKVPPDGGWGYVIILAMALNNVIVIPIIQNFGLIFKDTLRALDISATNITVIMNVNNAFGLGLGLINGALLRRYGYRKIGIIGSVLVFVGVALTAIATSFWQFLLFYGLIMSAGFGVGMAAFSLALNTYFRKKRGQAMGFAMTITGLGPVVMPHLMSLSMIEYGARGTALLLAALSLHSLAGSILLQPIKWHLKDEEPTDVEENIDEEKSKEIKNEVDKADSEALKPMLNNPKVEENHQFKYIDHQDEMKDRLNVRAPMLHRRISTSSHKSTDQERGMAYWAAVGSMHSVELGGSTMQIDIDAMTNKEEEANRKNSIKEKEELEKERKAKNDSTFKKILRRIVAFFDLNLLKDPIYVNLMLGMSSAVFAEINFSLLTPFILEDHGLDTPEIATMMSIIAGADIVLRSLAAYIGKALKQNSRVMYMLSLVLLVTTRTFLIFAHDFTPLIFVSIALGVAKGIRTVFWSLVIPDYVPLERLPAASGIQSVVNGLMFLILGPLIGIIRDRTGNYDWPIVTLNLFTTLTVIMWSVEFAIVAVNRKRKENSPKEDQFAID